MSRHVVAGVAEVPPGTAKLASAKGRDIGLFNVAGKFYALANRCPHKGGPLCHGRITGLAQSGGPGDYRLVADGDGAAAKLEEVYRALAARRHPADGDAEIERRLQERPLIDVDLHMHTDHSPDCATPV